MVDSYQITIILRSALAAKQHFCVPDAKQMIVLEDAKGVPCVGSSTWLAPCLWEVVLDARH